MGVDKIKFFNYVKIFIILIYLTYVVIWVSKFNSSLPLNKINYNNEYNQKINHEIKRGIVLLGGSNVRIGLSAEFISNDFLDCYNLGLVSELNGFSNYVEFLTNRVFSPDIIIYSPSYVWEENINLNNNFDFLPNFRLISQIRYLFNPKIYDNIHINSFGDCSTYDCEKNFNDFKINKNKFSNQNKFIVEEISRRVEIIKKISNCDKVLIRIPPVYAHSYTKKLLIENMQQRIKLLKESGLIIIDGTLVSSDKSFYSDNFHPNRKGRLFFSRELKNEIMKYTN